MVAVTCRFGLYYDIDQHYFPLLRSSSFEFTRISITLVLAFLNNISLFSHVNAVNVPAAIKSSQSSSKGLDKPSSLKDAHKLSASSSLKDGLKTSASSCKPPKNLDSSLPSRFLTIVSV